MIPYKSIALQHLRPYRICSRCCMDTSDHEIWFDDEGVCSHCHYFKNQLKHYWYPDEQGRKKLEKIVDEVRQLGKGKQYDSIIGLSGGVDSSYLACRVKELGLRPLAVHVDGGWNSELAVKNIEQIVSLTGLDLVTHVVDWEEMRDLQLAFLKSHVANQDTPQDHAFFAALYNFAVSNGIKYVISGSNYATESVLPVCWGFDPMDIRQMNDIHAKFGSRKLKTFPTVGFFKFHYYYPIHKQMTVLRPLNFMHYSKTEAIEYLEKNYGWRYYGGKHYESRWTRFFQAYYLPTKFGYDKRKAHLASLVVSGEMSRDEALRELEKPLYDPKDLKEDKAFVAKKLGISLEELDALVQAKPLHYTDYKNNELNARLFYRGYSAAAGIKRRISRFLD